MLQTGKIDRSQLTPVSIGPSISDAQFAQIVAGQIGSLGDPVTFEQKYTMKPVGSSWYVYLLTFPLRQNDIPVTYLVFDNEGHGFTNLENNKRFTALAEKFLAETLGGKLQPPQPDEDFTPFLH
jgi:hypothetical protein